MGPEKVHAAREQHAGYDQEEHRRMRGIADQAFLRSEVEGLRPRIQAICDQMLDQFEQQASKSKDKSADALDIFCRQLPLAVICEVLGLPQEDRPKFTKWFQGFSEIRNMLGIVGMLPNLRKVMNYLEQQFELFRKNPRPGLLSELVQAESEGEKLNSDELVATSFVLLAAGHETTVHLISNGLVMFLLNREQRRLVEVNPSLMPSAIDEILRLGFVIQMSKPRYVIHDTEFHDVQLRRGELIAAVFGSANIDPEKFYSPETFDITRFPNPHMTFGTGVHICLGVKLAKVEAAIALERTLRRFPNLQLAIPDTDIDWSRRIGMRTLRKLPLRMN
ncbi:MAG: cytochrome P450 [Planctomycetota bacterium]|nr:cytochrome P450 [Planctomycetota bacterium]